VSAGSVRGGRPSATIPPVDPNPMLPVALRVHPPDPNRNVSPLGPLSFSQTASSDFGLSSIDECQHRQSPHERRLRLW